MLATRPQLGEGLPLLPFLTIRLTGHRRAQSTHPLDAQPADLQVPLPPSGPPSANLASPARVVARPCTGCCTTPICLATGKPRLLAAAGDARVACGQRAVPAAAPAS